MGKIVAEKKKKQQQQQQQQLQIKKKKGRPSLSDLHSQIRIPQNSRTNSSLNHHHANRNPNPNSRNPDSGSPNRRVTRRLASIQQKDDDSEEEEEEEDDDEKREKKLKLVLKLSRSLRTVEENEEEENEDDEEEESGEKPLKKRKIEAVSETRKGGICNGSGGFGSKEAGSGGEKVKYDLEGAGSQPPGAGSRPEARSDHIGGTALPDMNLLLFIINRLQNKDIYGVFSEPVNPDELPDYHEVIDHPMDFKTLKDNLTDAKYTSLEEFESDVYLICTNAMKYNAPETIYYKQARSIHDLAKKSFQDMRQDANSIEFDSKPQRGRPSLMKKFLRQSVGKSDATTGDHSSDGRTANSSYSPLSKTPHELQRKSFSQEKPSGILDSSGKALMSFRNIDTSTSLMDRLEKNEAFSGAMGKGFQFRNGKKAMVSDENCRATYKLSPFFAETRDPVLSTLDGEKKQLLPVGVHVQHAYARSLARFASNLGPVAWKVASLKIERALPAGTKFGPGWVGESEAPQATSSQVKAVPITVAQQPESTPGITEVHEPLKDSNSEAQQNPKQPPTENASANRIVDSEEAADHARSTRRENMSNLFSPGVSAMKPPFHLLRHSVTQSPVNGMAAAFTLQSPIGKPVHGSSLMPSIRPARLQENAGLARSSSGMDPSMQSQMLDMASRGSAALPASTAWTQLETEQPRVVAVHGKAPFGAKTAHSDVVATTSSYNDQQPSRPQASWRGLQLHQKSDTMPPDLNIGFQSPSSPARQSSSMTVDTQQPDLALQL